MRKILGILILGLFCCNVGVAQIKYFDCLAVKDNSIYEKNVRLFDTKKGAYISIKKKNNSETKYTINQITGDDLSKPHKFKFKSWDIVRISPFNQKLWEDEDFEFDDYMVLPRVMWGEPAHPSTYWKHPNNPEGNLVLVETYENFKQADKSISRAHMCKENKNEKMSKKEFKKIKKKSKPISAFETLALMSDDINVIPITVAERILEKEKEINQKAQKTHGISHSFTFEDKKGNKISRNNQDSLWKKFWGTVGWVLYEHGDDILNLAIDLKYGSTQETKTPRMYCVSQKVGKTMVQTSCRQR